ncbi:unnamed protein product, partial [Mesorhabditis spiculigera]
MLIFFILLTCLPRLCALNILVYSPRYAPSHTNFVGRVADILAEAGHQVVVLQPVLIAQQTGTGIALAKVIELPPSEHVGHLLPSVMSVSDSERWTSSGTDPRPTIQFLTFMRRATLDFTKRIFEDEPLLEELRGYKFDIGFSECLEGSGFAIFHRIGLDKYIGILSSTFGASFPSIFGAPMAPAYVPSMSSSSTDQMSFVERAMNLVGSVMEKHMITGGFAMFDDYLRTVDPEFPKIEDLLTGSSFVLANVEPYYDHPRPLILKLQYFGGIAVPEPRPLEQKWKDILNLRPANVLISFGSIAKSKDMPRESKMAIIKAIKSFPDVTFIWKYEAPEELPEAQEAPNLILHPWVPQADLLADNRLTAFITHGGAGSAIVVPLFADQFANAKLVGRVGSTLEYNKFELGDAAKLESAIRELLDNETLTKNAERMAAMLANRPFPPREVLLKTTEFAAAYGPLTELDPHGRQLSFIEYFLLDRSRGVEYCRCCVGQLHVKHFLLILQLLFILIAGWGLVASSTPFNTVLYAHLMPKDFSPDFCREFLYWFSLFICFSLLALRAVETGTLAARLFQVFRFSVVPVCFVWFCLGYAIYCTCVGFTYIHRQTSRSVQFSPLREEIPDNFNNSISLDCSIGDFPPGLPSTIGSPSRIPGRSNSLQTSRARQMRCRNPDELTISITPVDETFVDEMESPSRSGGRLNSSFSSLRILPTLNEDEEATTPPGKLRPEDIELKVSPVNSI